MQKKWYNCLRDVFCLLWRLRELCFACDVKKRGSLNTNGWESIKRVAFPDTWWGMRQNSDEATVEGSRTRIRTCDDTRWTKSVSAITEIILDGIIHFWINICQDPQYCTSNDTLLCKTTRPSGITENTTLMRYSRISFIATRTVF